jgi:hypothetical protein
LSDRNREQTTDPKSGSQLLQAFKADEKSGVTSMQPSLERGEEVLESGGRARVEGEGEKR